ncbi:hypothetical protein M569_05841, partial [Genlisea aurea]
RKNKSNLLSRVLEADFKTSIFDVLNEWVKEHNTIGRGDVSNLVQYFKNRRNFKSAVQVREWAESHDIQMNNADRAVHLHLLFRTKGLPDAEEYFKNLEESEKTDKTYGALLYCYCKELKHDMAVETFEKMKMQNMETALNYTYMMTLYSVLNQPEKVISMGQEMVQKNMDLNLYAYNLLINSYGAMGDLDGIKRTVEEMKSKNVKFVSSTCSTIAKVYLKSGLNTEASIILRDMEKMLKQPGEEKGFTIFLSLAKFYTWMNDLSGVIRAWESLKEKHPVPSNTCFYATLNALVKLGDVEALQKHFASWESSCVVYDVRLVNVMLEFYLDRDMIDEASKLHDKSIARGFQPNIRTINSLLKLCLSTGETDLALQYLEMAEGKTDGGNKKHPYLSEEVIESLTSMFEDGNDPERAAKFSQIMKKIKGSDS